MTHLFPDTQPRTSGHLSVGEGHSLYWERCGRPDGLPVLVLHGGPGSGISPRLRRLFDPERFDIILFDQRGCGRSTPHLSVDNNTTAELIADIEALRGELGVERWIVFGPSWGSTLALAYAEAHPDRVSALVPEAVFLGGEADLRWMFDPEQGSRAFPDAHADFIDPVPHEWRGSVNLLLAWCNDAMAAEVEAGFPVLRRLADPDATREDLRASTIYRWNEYEDRLSYLDLGPQEALAGLRQKGADQLASRALVEMHYFRHNCFLERDQLIRQADALKDIEMHILHSRYDMVCPIENAFRLAEACPHAKLHIVPVNGHAMTEATQGPLNAIMDEIAGHLDDSAH
ncbi:prolyl aminopeptidase [Maricaulis sp. CAU 1757]